MLEPRKNDKLMIRPGRRAFFVALPGVAAFAVAFCFLSLTTSALQRAAPPFLSTPTVFASPPAPITARSYATSKTGQWAERLAIPGKPVVAAWEWGKRKGKGTDYFNERIIHIQSPQSRAYFVCLTQCGINRLYLQVGIEGERLAYNEFYLAGFLSRAKQKGIEVYALFGQPSFAEAKNHVKANAIVKAILRYNEAHPDAAFAGIQSDIEPYYEFTGCGTTRPADLRVMGPQYIAEIENQRKLVDRYREETGRGLKLEAAIPFWYNIPAQESSCGRKPLKIFFDGFDGTITDHVIRLTDSVAVMSYRNDDDGKDGVSGVARYVVDAAGRYNREHNSHKKVIIGLETKKPGTRGVIPKITIRMMTWKTLWTKILKRLGQRYRKRPTVDGVAYNHTVSLFEIEKRWAAARRFSPPFGKTKKFVRVPSQKPMETKATPTITHP